MHMHARTHTHKQWNFRSLSVWYINQQDGIQAEGQQRRAKATLKNSLLSSSSPVWGACQHPMGVMPLCPSPTRPSRSHWKNPISGGQLQSQFPPFACLLLIFCTAVFGSVYSLYPIWVAGWFPSFILFLWEYVCLYSLYASVCVCIHACVRVCARFLNTESFCLFFRWSMWPKMFLLDKEKDFH